jgi:hypothetical protein
MMVVAVLALTFGLWGCGGSSGGGGGPAASSAPALRIAMTDAPFPFSSVTSATVELQRIDIRRQGGGFETLKAFPGGKLLELVELRNGITEVLFEGNPGPGNYDALRLVVLPKKVVIDEDGTPRSFTDFAVPSGPQTGIKVFIDPVISVVTGLTLDLVLDFDLSRSFVVQGNPATPAGIKGFHFKPVIRAVNASRAGSLTFRLRSDNGTPDDLADDFCLDGAEYTVLDPATDPATVMASGATGRNPGDATDCGYAYHPAIIAGSYEIQIAATGHDAYTAPVSIVAANLTDLGTVTLTASGRVIEGTVTTELTATTGVTLTIPVADAGVAAMPAGQTTAEATDTTNAMGAYFLSPLALVEPYDVQVTKAGYVDAVAAVAPWIYGTPSAPPANFVLDPLLGDVQGVVIDATGSPVAGGQVRATVDYQGAPQVIAETVIGTDGTYSLSGLPTGSYLIAAVAPVGAETKTATEPLEHVGGATSPTTVNLTLP